MVNELPPIEINMPAAPAIDAAWREFLASERMTPAVPYAAHILWLYRAFCAGYAAGSATLAGSSEAEQPVVTRPVGGSNPPPPANVDLPGFMRRVYVVTVNDGKVRYCPTCALIRPVFAFVEDGIKSWGCCSCSRVFHTEPA